MKELKQDPHQQELIVSYLLIRKSIGTLGLLLPVILFAYSCVAGATVQISISHYYFTEMRNVFVVILSFISLFLLCYGGYNTDRYYSIAAGICGFIVVFVHTTYKPTICMKPDVNIRDIIHLGSAAIFIGLLGFMSFWLFTKTHGGVHKKAEELSSKKAARNRIYRICGVIIFSCLLLMVLYFMIDDLREKICHYNPVFWLESVAVVAFGFSWLVKGETLLKD
jgi:hypothetical protein